MFILDALLLILVVVGSVVWVGSAYINFGVLVIRCSGSSSVSAVPGIATVSGLTVAVIVREWFGLIVGKWIYLVGVAPEVARPLGDVIFWLRVRILGFPDRARR